MGRMASEIEGDVKKTLLDRTDAEKVFRPWWDTVEDYLLNSLIAIGKGRFQKITDCIQNFSYSNR